MAHSTRTVPIIIASVIAVTLMAGAYVLSGPIPFINTVTAESSEALLRAYAAKDTDADGLQDWQESLYGTDPLNPTSFRADIQDGEAANQGLLTPKSLETPDDDGEFPGTAAAPSSLTERFAQKFLAQYLSTRGANPPTEQEMLAFVEDAIKELTAEATAKNTFDSRDIRTATGADLATYVAAVENAIEQNAADTGASELDHVERYIEDNDAAASRRMKEISAGYAAIGEALIKLSVPAEMAQSHLALANAFMGLSRATEDLSTISTDPILALLGFGVHRTYSNALVDALSAQDSVFRSAGLSLTPGTAGEEYVKGAAAATALRASQQP